MPPKTRKRLGEILIDAGKLTREQLEDALALQKKSGKMLGKVLVIENFVTQQDILDAFREQLGISSIDLEKTEIDRNACLVIPENIARRHNLIPVKVRNNTVIVAMADPLNYFALDDIRIFSGMEVEPIIAQETAIETAINKYYTTQKAIKALEEYNRDQVAQKKDDEILTEDIDDTDSAPVVKLVNSIIEQAIRNRASDIHIEPFGDTVRVRYRIDGILYENMKLDSKILGTIVTRIKVSSGMNIAEKRAPQDGRMSFKLEVKNYDLRTSIVRTIHGEKVVIRVVDKDAMLISKDMLGFLPGDEARFEKLLASPFGMIIVTGPTGSGKTTTLYSAVKELNSTEVNIITVEDPVEGKIEGINQIQIAPKSGLDFATILRSILRQDPDIILIGEVRDSETAQIAIKAAVTGHLVLTTLHTNDAIGSIYRFVNMGVEKYMVASALVGVVAQRLIKKICKNCRIEYEPTDDEIRILELNTSGPIKLSKGKGCPYCSNTGYRGRIGVYEVLHMTKEMREMINGGATEEELRRMAEYQGMKSLRDNTKELVLQGVTTIKECIRVSQTFAKSDDD